MSQQALQSNVIGLSVNAPAGGRGILPRTLDECARLGDLLSKSSMTPSAFRGKPADCTVAIMQGLELGLSPVSAMQSIAVVNGRPCLYGDGFLAVIRASGLLEWCKETDDGQVATCVMKRAREPEPVTRTFSADDAQRAGLAGKDVWKSYPARMRQMRARGFCGRDLFADVLRGINLAEEAQDIPMRDVTPKTVVAAAVVKEPEPKPAAEAVVDAEFVDPETGELHGSVIHLEIIKLIDETHADYQSLLRHFGVESLSDLTMGAAEQAKTMLTRKRDKQQASAASIDAMAAEISSLRHGE